MSNNSGNRLVIPAAREAMDKFKMEAASEVGVNLKNGYNGELTARQAGSVGGQMVKKMIEAYENGLKKEQKKNDVRISGHRFSTLFNLYYISSVIYLLASNRKNESLAFAFCALLMGIGEPSRIINLSDSKVPMLRAFTQ